MGIKLEFVEVGDVVTVQADLSDLDIPIVLSKYDISFEVVRMLDGSLSLEGMTMSDKGERETSQKIVNDKEGLVQYLWWLEQSLTTNFEEAPSCS